MATGVECVGWAARDQSGVLSRHEFSRRAIGDDDICFKITHCGICYAEAVWLFNKHGDTKYPIVPGHEIVGVVAEVGSNVTRFKVGDRAGVGAYCRSCGSCDDCDNGMENYCHKSLLTYNYEDIDGTITKGGFSNKMVVHSRYAFQIPDKLSSSDAAPLLCAGITVYSPMKRYGMISQTGKHLGVIGLGGLGHMAVKFGKAFGHKVTVLSTSPGKKEDALTLLGADEFLVTKDPQALHAAEKSIDWIIDTAAGKHDLNLYLPLLKTGGHLVMVGVPPSHEFAPHLMLPMRSISGSSTGGCKEIEEMLQFCADKKILPNIEIVPIDYANTAIQRMIKSDVTFRFVIDIASSLK
ncbi:hypothetical protein SELMODRAFT_149351 [Selaginella moellendorffii]|uniref:Enoyl reductase (ER) domain-containing protein n=1 Tax=Selaginella moellendorffii TaxID=88036 RepID=D8RS04_SELML|nr:probable cinnamyl alcohol dehydrogenase 1 [Selaginella moellendorffii]EFJ24981.1 hypothetical protein SELMODRAFT_149351 [Selaginella moellendorffii]|eukprot:XP_002974026.1 probable cinnamyl alcohol dehydrogenase 1 [Selaginella moellendorffii]